MSPLLIGKDGNQTPSALSFRVWKSFPADKMPEIRACVFPHDSKSVDDVKRTEIYLKMWIIGGNCANQWFMSNPSNIYGPKHFANKKRICKCTYLGRNHKD